MGTIVARPRKDGGTAYMAKIIVRREGRVVQRESKTFDRRPAANAWMAKREAELARTGHTYTPPAPAVTLADAIDRYITDSRREIGRSKTQVLRAIKAHDIAGKRCDEIASHDLTAFAQELCQTMQPQTAGNYLSHLAAVFAVAQPAWGIPLDRQAMTDARIVTKRLGLTSKSISRDRRPTLAELDRLMTRFQEVARRRPSSVPMNQITAFAIFSTRRQEEITRIRWADLDGARILVRDMKNPGERIGNHAWCDLPPEALAIIQSMPKTSERIFPYSTDAISAAFTRACHLLQIDDLRFHDLRHDGVSRLFELSWSIPHVATVSGHRSWSSLKRYTHIRDKADKYEGWSWLASVTQPWPSRP